MRRTIALMMLACGGVAAAQPAAAPVAAEAPCPLPLVAPPPFNGWSRPAPLVAAERRGAKPLPVIVLGQAAAVTLAPSNVIAFDVAPARAGGPTSYGGMIYLRVPAAGTYRVALGGPIWIDMIAGGRVVASGAHGHGPTCSGIAKMVDFTLAPGTYTIELSAAKTPVTTAMVARVG